MKKIIIIGGSRGIGKAIVHALLPSHQIINISRSVPEYSHANLSHHS
jgi:NAD(P)-dependent dehydrogenase (short-subunit alcohol dehydrogenase family)